MAQTELTQLLGGPDDRRNAIVTLHPGAGGTESAGLGGNIAALVSTLGGPPRLSERDPRISARRRSRRQERYFHVEGDYAYGYLKAEAGIHRLCGFHLSMRILDGTLPSRRFFVYPEVDDTIKIEINEADLRVDTYRSSGAGGQHVNKTDSAAFDAHAHGIVVACQNDAHNIKNRAMAMKILRSRLYELEIEKQKEKMEIYHKTKKDIRLGQPDSLLCAPSLPHGQDHRTGVEVGNADAVLDGDIDQFIQA